MVESYSQFSTNGVPGLCSFHFKVVTIASNPLKQLSSIAEIREKCFINLSGFGDDFGMRAKEITSIGAGLTKANSWHMLLLWHLHWQKKMRRSFAE
jgi:hypothetical protein